MLSAFFALFSFAMIIPFLRVLFGNQPVVTETMDFTLSTDYFMHTLNYFMGRIMITHGNNGALVLVSVLVTDIPDHISTYGGQHMVGEKDKSIL